MELKNDIQVEIATANNRKSKAWKNKKVLWSAILEKLSTCTHTPETMAEYARMSKDRQSQIKDVGGFVGGYCAGGNRSDTKNRTLVTLDADFGDAGIWEDWQMLYGNAAALYSTHKHKPTAQRLRLVIPLTRKVGPDEYQAISRRIAESLGIEKFDDTTYQPQRLMFWPSASADGEYVFKYIDAPALDPDAILSTYEDWHDMSTWPTSSRVAEITKKATEKQKDPTEKDGMVGVFCRTYTIEEAIAKYVPDYEPGSPGRYTYVGGTTAEGVVVYDNKFSYSFHSTDPACGQLCNAWDLVRLHQFKELDKDVDEDTPPSKLPSYKAMVDLATKDEAVKINLVKEKADKVADDFDEIPEDAEAEEEDEGWQKHMTFTAAGVIAQTIDNVVTVLQHDPKLKNRLAINDFEHTLVTLKDLPWRKINEKNGSIWTDSDDANLRHYLERVYGLSSQGKIYDGVNVVAERNSFHPVRTYLAGCSWDGVERLDTLLIKYLGAEDTEYTRAVTRKTFVAAVARILNPGCKFDYMLTIKGRQGLGKSSIVAKLASDWFSDSFQTVQGKEAYEQIQGRWIIEVAELAAMKKSEAEMVKQFISKKDDRFRPAYGRRTESFPRQCIFIGTTNEQQFLKDTTGNRRYWVVDTPNEPTASFWDDFTPEVVQNIWGEAITKYKAGETLFLTPELEKEARKVQEAYAEENAQAGLVLDYLERKVPANWTEMDTYDRRAWLASDAEGTEERRYVCHIEIWAEVLGGDPAKLDYFGVKNIQGIMASLPNWRYRPAQKRNFKPYGKQRYYEKVDD